MFSVLLTAMLSLGSEGAEATLHQTVAEVPNQTGFVVIADCVGLNSADQVDLSCNCIRSSSSYAWRWLGIDIKDGRRPLCERSCPSYYHFYGRKYDFRRGHDYPWRSEPYRSRKIPSRCAECNRGQGIKTRPGDEEFVTTPKVRVLASPK